MSETCGTCRYYEQGFFGDSSACRRYPPSLPSGCKPENPAVKSDGWCGEWATKDMGRTCATEEASFFDTFTRIPDADPPCRESAELPGVEFTLRAPNTAILLNELRSMMKGWREGVP